MNVLESIDAAEEQMSNEIKCKIDFLTSLIFDSDMFDKMIIKANKNIIAANINPSINNSITIQTVMNEIKEDEKIVQLLYANFAIREQTTKVIEKKEATEGNDTIFKNNDKMIIKQFYSSKAYGSNLSVSNYVNYYNQNNCQSFPINIFYYKETELSLRKEVFISLLKDQIRKKFLVVYLDSMLDSTKQDNQKKKTILKEYNHNFKEMHKNLLSYNNQKKIDSCINRMYPKPKLHSKENLMNIEIINEKLIDYYYMGEIHSKIDMKDLMNKYKVGKKKYYHSPLNQIYITNSLVQNYIEIKKANELKKKKRLKHISIDCKIKKNEEKIFIETKSNLYKKFDRNRSDLKICNKKKQSDIIIRSSNTLFSFK